MHRCYNVKKYDRGDIMSEKGMDYREVSNEFIKKWTEDGWKEFYKNHKDELFLGIRHQAVNLYYNGYSLCKVSLKARKNGEYLSAEINNKYVDESCEEKKSTYRKIDIPELKEKYDIIKGAITAKNERRAQQKLIMQTNSNPESDWYCIDMEYVKSTKGEEGGSKFGRFDIIAISKKEVGKVALIELKYGGNAIAGSSGVYSHTQDFYRFWVNKQAREFVKKNICGTIESLQQLKIFPFDNEFLKDFELNYNTEFYFIALDSKLRQKGDVRVQMQKYLLDIKYPKPSTKYNVEINGIKVNENDNEVLKINVVKGTDNGFKPIFLFSDDCGDSIKDVISSSLYESGLRSE